MDIVISLPIPPSLNRRHASVGGRLINTSEYRRYKQEAEFLILQSSRLKKWKMRETERMSVKILIYQKGTRRDLDNNIKPILDSAEGALYKNDSQVDILYVERIQVLTTIEQRIEFIVEEI